MTAWPSSLEASPVRLPTWSTGTRTRRRTSCPCPRECRASWSRPGIPTARCASCPTAVSSSATTRHFPRNDNLGSAKPYKQPADGEELDEPNGSFSGQTLYVPGPYKMPGQTHRQRFPSDVQRRVQQQPDLHRVVWSTSPATCSGTTSPPRRVSIRRRAADDWWSGSRPVTRRYCIVYGPDHRWGRAPPHRRVRRAGPARDDGARRQRRRPRPQRRDLERAPLRGVVAAHQCGAVPRWDLPAEQGADVTSFVKRHFVSGWDRQGPDLRLLRHQHLHRGSRHPLGDQRRPARNGTRPGARDAASPTSARARTSTTPSAWPSRPTGRCTSSTSTSPARARSQDAGRRTTAAGHEGDLRPAGTSTPVAVAGGFDFPTSVTVCVPSKSACPYPTGAIVAPLSGPSENPAPDAGPSPTPRRRPASAERTGSGGGQARPNGRRAELCGGSAWVSSSPSALAGCSTSARGRDGQRGPVAVRPEPVVAGTLGLADVRPRRPTHLPRSHDTHGRRRKDAEGGVVLPHRRRRDRDADGGGRDGLRRVVGRALLRARTSRPAPFVGSTELSRRMRSPRTPARTPGTPPPTVGWSPRRPGTSRATEARPNLVIFGGGYTLYALNAATGAVYWSHDYTGRPELAARSRPRTAPASSRRPWSWEIWCSSASTSTGQGTTGATSRRPDLNTGEPVWEFQTDVDAAGQVLNDGCGSVWSSGTVLPRLGLVVFDTADCDFSNVQRVLGVDPRPAHRDRTAWRGSTDPHLGPTLACDWDFGATPNAGLTAGGHRHVPRGRRQGRDLLLARPGDRSPAMGDQRRLRRVRRRLHRHRGL